jgi:hypothetical protein
MSSAANKDNKREALKHKDEKTDGMKHKVQYELSEI